MAIAVGTTRQSLADNYKTLGTWISVHTSDPGSTGTGEASGGTPAYARKQTTWTSATGGVVNGSQVTIDLPAGTFAWIGLWSASSGGTFIDKCAITSTTLGAQGQLLVTPTFTQS
ncbi:hypothetical protein [Nocardia sp. NPDC050793]|uniref:phage tail fiber protein n=1 Tax=Nocardia sp. NPDC050793 TaxID=3155159 RepID=UPI0033DBE8A8